MEDVMVQMALDEPLLQVYKEKQGLTEGEKTGIYEKVRQ